MRFFDLWWEHAPTIMRLTPLVVAILSLALSRSMDYYWE
jgi:hypothetical protein